MPLEECEGEGGCSWQAIRQAIQQAIRQAIQQAIRQAIQQAIRQAIQQAIRQAIQQTRWKASWKARWKASWKASWQASWQAICILYLLGRSSCFCFFGGISAPMLSNLAIFLAKIIQFLKIWYIFWWFSLSQNLFYFSSGCSFLDISLSNGPINCLLVPIVGSGCPHLCKSRLHR